jgi:hypothetical protein
MGIYTGLYYFFSQLAGILAPESPAFSGIPSGTDPSSSRAVCLFEAFLMMGLVRKGNRQNMGASLPLNRGGGLLEIS